MLKILAYRKPDGTCREESREELPRLLADESVFLWLDFEAPTPAEAGMLADPLHLHPVVIETCREPTNSARLQDLDDHVLITVHEALPPKEASEELFDTIEVDVVVGARYLVTYHEGPVECVRQLGEALLRTPRPFGRGPWFVLYDLLDRLVDAYLPVMDKIDDEVEKLEDRVVGRPEGSDLEAILTLRRSLQRIRRATARHREILTALFRDDMDLVPDDIQPYFRSVYDHLVRVADLGESYRDLLGGVLDAYLSTTSNRMNEVMKFLTVIATIMMPMTCIAGVYGMNFDPNVAGNMPETEWPYGYFFALGLMAVVGIGLIIYFRYRRWL